MPRLSEYEIRVTGEFRAMPQLDCFSTEIDRRHRLPIYLNLSEVTFMRPLAVVGTIIFLETMISRGRTIRFHWPRRHGVLNYLVGIGLPSALDDLRQWHWPDDFPREPVRRLKPMIKLTKLASTADVERVAGEMIDIFQTDMTGYASLLQPCHLVFSELADNSLAHSGSHAYVLAQKFEYPHGTMIDITVGDGGVGVSRSLAENPAYRSRLSSNEWALSLALQDGVSVTGDPSRGFGLGHVKGELAAPGRSLIMRSSGELAYRTQGRAPIFRECGASVGTLVHSQIPC